MVKNDLHSIIRHGYELYLQSIWTQIHKHICDCAAVFHSGMDIHLWTFQAIVQQIGHFILGSIHPSLEDLCHCEAPTYPRYIRSFFRWYSPSRSFFIIANAFISSYLAHVTIPCGRFSQYLGSHHYFACSSRSCDSPFVNIHHCPFCQAVMIISFIDIVTTCGLLWSFC